MVWLKSEVTCLKQNFPTMKDNSLAKVIGRSPNALRIKASRLGVKKEITEIRENLKLTPEEKQLVVGGLLGDSHCRYTHTSKNARMEVAHGESQKEYLLWKSRLLKRLGSKLKRTKNNAYWYETRSLPALNKYHDLFYNKGFKSITKEILDLLNDFGLLIWYLDDGSLSKRDKDIGLYTNGFSYEEQLLITKWFKEKYNLNPKIYRTRNPKNYPGKIWHYIHFNVNDSKKLITLFRKFEVPDCMKYKLGLHKSHSTI